MKNLDVNILET